MLSETKNKLTLLYLPPADLPDCGFWGGKSASNPMSNKKIRPLMERIINVSETRTKRLLFER